MYQYLFNWLKKKKINKKKNKKIKKIRLAAHCESNVLIQAV